MAGKAPCGSMAAMAAMAGLVGALGGDESSTMGVGTSMDPTMKNEEGFGGEMAKFWLLASPDLIRLEPVAP